LSFHCGSAQFFSTIAADSVALAGATGVESEQAARNSAIKARTPNRIAASPRVERPRQNQDRGSIRPSVAPGGEFSPPNFGDCKALPAAARRPLHGGPGRASLAALKAYGRLTGRG
jgi:hypothetical protein